MFCIKCGKPAWKDNLCKECFLEKNELFSIKNSVVRIKECSCGRYFIKKWVKPKKSIIEDITNDNIKLLGDISEKSVSWKRKGNKYIVRVRAVGTIGGLQKEEEKEYIIITRKNMCDVCTKRKGNYYEAQIQLRGVSLKKFFSILPKKDRDKITKLEKVRNGFNIYLSDKKMAKKIIVGMKRLNLNIKPSYKLVGMKKGRKIYRDYYSVKPLG